MAITFSFCPIAILGKLNNSKLLCLIFIVFNLVKFGYLSDHFCVIFTLTYDPVPFIIWKNVLGQVCSRSNPHYSISIFTTCSWGSADFKYDSEAYLTEDILPDGSGLYSPHQTGPGPKWRPK